MIYNCCIALGVTCSLCSAGAQLPKGVSRIDYAGYTGCICLENDNVRVVLSPQCGGRVLEYSWKGRNILYLNSKQDGWTDKNDKRKIDPYGGRFDIGPEMTIPKHPLLWMGKWDAKITGNRTACMISQQDTETGVQLIRTFRLAGNSSHLRCTQTILNVSQQVKNYCHWSRTLAVGGGICFIPNTADSRFPKSYIMYGPGATILYRPTDPNIKVDKDLIEITGAPLYPKLGFDSYGGWLAYLAPNNLLFIKKFRVYPRRVYNEIAGLTISIYYYKDIMCELEPIGPREKIEPGHSASFTEDWWLIPYDYPEKPDLLDRNDVLKKIRVPK